MVPRYSRMGMSAVWAPQHLLSIWFEIEAHAADALAQAGVIPKSAAATIWEKGKAPYDLERIDAIERETKHDVLAFTTHLAERIGP